MCIVFYHDACFFFFLYVCTFSGKKSVFNIQSDCERFKFFFLYDFSKFLNLIENQKKKKKLEKSTKERFFFYDNSKRENHKDLKLSPNTDKIHNVLTL